MKIKFLVPVLALLTFAVTACDDDKKGSDLYSGDNASGTLPNSPDTLNMANGNGPDTSGANGIDESQRPPGVNPDTDVDYSTLESITIYFEFDKSTIPASERGKLEAVKQWMDANPGRSLFLAGNADKRGTPEYNLALGERRALAVREYLAGLGLQAGNLYTNSYGADRPAMEGDSEEAYAKNRRVQIGVINQK
jgi:outer membrane protein OmpA-like peptidoglycan-associated protein